MATCAAAVLQPDGSYILKLDPSVVDVSTCAYVVASGTDKSIWELSAEDGAVISSGIVSCWFAAFIFKSIINVIRGSHEDS